MSKDKTFTDLPKKDQERIKQEYLEGKSLAAISRENEIARTSLSYHANKYWKEELNLLRAELFSNFSTNKKANFIKMSESAIAVMSKALQELAEREYPPTIREAKDATVILESLDKITRLDDGSPTEIVAEKPISIKELKAKLALDPFSEEGEIEDATFKEISENAGKRDVSSGTIDVGTDSNGRDEGHLLGGDS